MRIKLRQTIVAICALLFASGSEAQIDPSTQLSPQAAEIQLYTAPDESSPPLESVRQGDTLSPVGETIGTGGDKWYLVKTKAGAVGWIKSGGTEDSKKLEGFFKSLPSGSSVSTPIEIPLISSRSAPPNAVTVPVEMTGSLVIVPVTLNRSLRTYLVLDTGATTTLVSRRVANRLGLSFLGSRTAMATVNGLTTAPLARLGSLKVGEAEVYNLVVPVHDFSLNPRVEGLLGLDFLNRFHVSIDPRKQVLVLAPR